MGLGSALKDVFAMRPAKAGGGGSDGGPSADAAGAERPGRRPAVRRRGITEVEARALYRPDRSFVDLLPWVEAVRDPESGLEAILLEDGESLGAAWEIVPLGTEGRSAAFLAEIRDGVQDVIQDAFEERDANPWVVQTYTWRDLDMRPEIARLDGYAGDGAKGTAYTDAYLALAGRHLTGAARDGGLFTDEEVTRERWGGATERTHLVLARRRGTGKFAANEPDDMMEALVETGARLTKALEGLGIRSRPLSGAAFHGRTG